MSSMAFIRNDILKITQSALAELAGVSQPTVCRWEKGELEPNRDQLERIRAAAIERGKEWNDAWFFETPETAE